VALITVTNRLTYIPWGTRNDTEITDIHGAAVPQPIQLTITLRFRVFVVNTIFRFNNQVSRIRGSPLRMKI
jgi:hypothetical protein